MAERRERQTREEREPAGEQGLHGRSFAGENYANTQEQQTDDRRAGTTGLDEAGEVPTASFPERTNRADLERGAADLDRGTEDLERGREE